MVAFSSLLGDGKRIATAFSKKNVPFMAASIAYHAFVSLAPILLFLLLIVSIVGGGLEQQVIDIARQQLPGPIADVVVTVFEGSEASPAASVVGLLVLLWGALKIFRGLDTAFSEIYETTEQSGFVSTLVDGLVVFFAIVLALLATVGVTVVFAAFSGVLPFVGLLTPLALVAGLIVAFLPMYRRFPDADVGWREIVPGTVFAAVGWAAFQSLFQVYLSVAGGGSESIFGGVIVVVTWLYFSGLVLLLGAVINAVLGGHTTEGSAGVGSDQAEIEHEARYNRGEFASYLESLRRSFTEHGTVTTWSEDDEAAYPWPNGDITVIERRTPSAGVERRSITIRWTAAGSLDQAEADARSPEDRPTDDDERSAPTPPE